MIMNPRWLTLKEASEYSSIGMKRLKKLALEKKIKGCKDPDNERGDWIFDRFSIDAYRERQMIYSTCGEKALAIIKGVPI